MVHRKPQGGANPTAQQSERDVPEVTGMKGLANLVCKGNM